MDEGEEVVSLGGNPFMRDGGCGSWRASDDIPKPPKEWNRDKWYAWWALVEKFVREENTFGSTFYDRLMNQPSPFPRSKVMNEQEYEKSIAEPTLTYKGAAFLTDDVAKRLKSEREFSRGAWKHLKALRDILYLSKEVFGTGPGVIAPVVPIPDVRPPEPRDTGAFITAHAALAKVGPLTKDVADEIIREVRARTVK